MKLLHVSILLLLTSCASLKYPNWENVQVVSCVHNKPCESKGSNETCKGLTSACPDWFKKRATLVNANTVLQISPTSTSATYFKCEAGLPLYKEFKEFTEYNDSIFNDLDHELYRMNGENVVSGQAFLRQKGGNVVTCAGEQVIMYPDTPYFNSRDTFIAETSALSNRCQITFVQDKNAETYNRLSQCDAQGNFEFNKVPAGNYIINVAVKWYSGGGTNGYEGGLLRKKITVQDQEPNKIIITE